MTVVHILISGLYREAGGLQTSVLRIARSLARSKCFRVIIYTRRLNLEYEGPDPAEIEIAHLGVQKSFLIEPLQCDGEPLRESVPSHFVLESLRMDYILLRNAVQQRMHAHPDAKHILISFYITFNGFVAQQVAFALGIPHIASVRGSDFSRDFRSPYHLQTIRFVVENAFLVVTTSDEQSRILGAAFPSARGFRTIHNATAEDVVSDPWRARSSDIVRLAADCEFSVKKGTHILLRAVAELVESTLPVSLTLAGRFASDANSSPEQRERESTYWQRCTQDYSTRFPGGAFCFPGWLCPAQVDDLLLSSDVYVSPSLSEGCSNAHIRALTLGIPIVATNTGVLPDLCNGAAHILLCPPADLPSLAAKLRLMVAAIRDGSVRVDRELVQMWRRHFSPERERDEWADVLAQAAAC